MNEVQKVQIVPLDVKTIPFHGTVAAHSRATLVSKIITAPFELQRVRVSFALNTNRTLRVEFFISPDDSAPTDKPLTGISVLSELGQVDYLVGDDNQVDVPMRILVTTANMRMKVFADNLDSYEHSIDAQVFIQLKPMAQAKPEEVPVE